VTVTGKTLAENVAGARDLDDKQQVIVSLDKPIKASGHIQILRGNLAPEGSVAKITGKEGLTFSGVANVFDSEEEMVPKPHSISTFFAFLISLSVPQIAALENGKITKGQVIVIRYEGPKGGPGMPEMRNSHIGWVQKTNPLFSLLFLGDAQSSQLASSWVLDWAIRWL